MFHLQPGTGVGFSGSREMALGLGGSIVVEDEGATAGLGYQAELRKRKRRDDDDLITIISIFMQIKDD